MKTKLLLFLFGILIACPAIAQYSFPACAVEWVSKPAAYQANDVVSYNGYNWKAKYYAPGVPGTDAAWGVESKCGDGALGPDYAGEQRLIGYLPYWAENFDYKNWDPSVVTHINTAFNMFKQNNNNYLSDDFASIAFSAFDNRKVDSILFDNGVLARAHAKGVSVSVAIGGATDYAFLWLMTRYANDEAKMEEIATLIANYVNVKGIDGVDLDMECWWPDAAIAGTTEQGGRIRGDKWGGKDEGPHPAALGLTNLAKKLRAKLPDKTISCAVFATANYGNNYDDAMAQYMNWVGLMTYDFTGSWSKSPIGPHSSLYKVAQGYEGQSDANPIYSVQDGLEFWMGMAPPAWNHDGGFNVPKSKLVFGVPLYGYDLSTKKPNNGNGFLTIKYNEIVAAYPDAAVSYDPLDTRQLNGYIGVNGKKIYYDTPKSAAAKVKYSKEFGHQGLIIWELTGDAPYNDDKSILKSLNDAATVASVEIAKDLRSAVVPNPSSSEFACLFKKPVASVHVMNVLGQIMYANNNVGMELSFGQELLSGTYLVMVLYADGNMERNVIEKMK